VVEITIGSDSPAAGRKLRDVTWPPGSTPVSVLRGRQLHAAGPATILVPGDRVNLLGPSPSHPPHQHDVLAVAPPGADGPAESAAAAERGPGIL
jgi:TrkA-C domain